jgi:hypothetical protein
MQRTSTRGRASFRYIQGTSIGPGFGRQINLPIPPLSSFAVHDALGIANTAIHRPGFRPCHHDMFTTLLSLSWYCCRGSIPRRYSPHWPLIWQLSDVGDRSLVD